MFYTGRRVDSTHPMSGTFRMHCLQPFSGTSSPLWQLIQLGELEYQLWCQVCDLDLGELSSLEVPFSSFPEN